MYRVILWMYAGIAYGVCFLLTLLFANMAERSRTKHRFVWYSILAVLVPSIFAGLRGMNVGVDVSVYAYPQFEKAVNAVSLGAYIDSAGLETGYSALVYFCGRYAKSFQLLLALTALMQVVPVYLCCVEMRERFSLTAGMLGFLCLLYIPAFNIMRQSVAAAWLLLAFVFIYQKKYVKGALAIVVAFGFHSTAIIGVMFIVLAMIFLKLKSNRLLMLTCIIFFAVFVILMQYWTVLIYALGNWGFLPYAKIVNYSRVFSGDSSSYLKVIDIAHYLEAAFKILFVIVPLIYRNRFANRLYNAVIGTCLIGLLVYLYFFLVFHTSYGYRVSIYAEYYLLLLLPILMNKHLRGRYAAVQNGAKRIGVRTAYPFRSVMVCVLVLVNWLLLFVVMGTHGTYPFHFFFE